MATLRKSHSTTKIINQSSLSDLPTPANIFSWWNFGSLLGLCLLLQVSTGLFLAMHYSANIMLAFPSLAHICRDVQYGWFIRNLHANGASTFFICLYLHIARGMYYGSYTNKKVWNVGIILLSLTMTTAFIGYVLPWGQMSFWGATVITNLLSALPYIGQTFVEWLWGGFSVDAPTLTRFFTFHFLLPFTILAMAVVHLLFLHQTGSNNPMGLVSDTDKISFHPYFSFKDLLGILVLILSLLLLALFKPNLLGDPENFIPANPLITPPHIKPEWYFLFAYAILRSVPNKLGGVMALILSILILTLIPLTHNSKHRSITFRPMTQFSFWAFIMIVLILTWIGGQPVEGPLIFIGQLTSILYFLNILTMKPMINKLENTIT